MSDNADEGTAVIWTARGQAGAAFEGDAALPNERVNYHRLLAVNPNYFGQLPGGAFQAESAMAYETGYEALCGVGYSPERRRLEATVLIKTQQGYGGPLCSTGSYEYVRFFVDTGAGFTDAGIVATLVHDIPIGRDCAGLPNHPLSYVVTIDYEVPLELCEKPQLPRIRAILSWQTPPAAGNPNFVAVWGDRRDVHIQLPSRRPKASDLLGLIEKAPKWAVNFADEELAQTPAQPLSVAALAHRYGQSAVPTHRYGLPIAAHILESGHPELLVEQAAIFSKAGLSWSDFASAVLKTSGDVSYEQLMCVGLDNNTDALVATFEIRQPYGYSGNPCSFGSTEYVAFWADWGDECDLVYLGTVGVAVHDFAKLPDGGLRYAAILPVNLSAIRRPCGDAVIGRVRAVLSWGTPPSTTDPDAVPRWGNFLTSHVQVRAGEKVSGPTLTVVGGIPVAMVEQSGPDLGLTLPNAVFRLTATAPDPQHRSCPFTGIIAVEGTGLALGEVYRLLVTDLTAGTPTTPVVNSFEGQDFWGNTFSVTPGGGGFTPAAGWGSDIMLGRVIDYTDGHLLRIDLQVMGVITSTVHVRTHSGLPTGDLEILAGDCKMFDGSATINGALTVHDPYVGSWALGVEGSGTLNVPSPNSGWTEATDEPWSLHLTGMNPCSYVLALTAYDRAINDSSPGWRGSTVYRGFAVEA